MASLLSSRALRSSLFSLPPQLRTKTYISLRSFSASPQPRMDLTQLAVAGPSLVLDTIHSLGVPWYATLPLTAILVRSTLVYILAVRPARAARETQSKLVALAHAHALIRTSNSRSKVYRYMKERSMRDMRISPRFDRMSMFWSYNGAMRHLGKQYGLARVKPWGLVNFGILIAFTEAIRLKCGTREGLLRLLLSPFEWLFGRGGEQQVAAATPPPLDPAEALALKLEAANEALRAAGQSQARLSDMDDLLTSSSPDNLTTLEQLPQPDAAVATTTPPPAFLNTTNPYYDPTMQTEGLSWIPDLTLSDPYFILPTALLLTMMANVLLRPSPFLTASTGRLFLGRKIYRHRLSLAFTWLFFFVMLKMPAAILLYFIPSMLAGWVQGRVMDWRRPVPTPIRPASKPERLKHGRGME